MGDPDAAGEYVISVDIGCQPSFSGSAEIVIQTENMTLVVFRALSVKLSDSGCYDDLGFAVVECERCSRSQFGYPNDEGLPEHPLYHQGLSDADGIAEVINSSWAAALEKQMETSARRIWGSSYDEAYSVPEGENQRFAGRHFIFTFKENTFECIADSLKLHLIKISYQEAISFINQRMADE